MFIRGKFKVDVLELFLHDKYDCGPFNEYRVAEYLSMRLTEMLVDQYSSVDVDPPDVCGLSRFLIRAHTYGDITFGSTERCYTEKELKQYLPKCIWDALAEIDIQEIKLK